MYGVPDTTNSRVPSMRPWTADRGKGRESFGRRDDAIGHAIRGIGIILGDIRRDVAQITTSAT